MFLETYAVFSDFSEWMGFFLFRFLFLFFICFGIVLDEAFILRFGRG